MESPPWDRELPASNREGHTLNRDGWKLVSCMPGGGGGGGGALNICVSVEFRNRAILKS